MSIGPTSFFAVPLIALAFAACGGASDTNFDNDPKGSAGESDGGTGGSTQGGSGGTSGSSSGSGGSQGAQGGTEATGGSSTGGSPNGGDAGTATGGSSTGGSSTGGSSTGGSSTGGSSTGGSSTGGSSTGGSSTGGSGGTLGGAGSGGAGAVAGRGGGGGKGGAGGKGDCTAIVTSAQAALLAAQACLPTSMTPKCTGSVQDLCGCTVPVNDPNSDATKSYLAQREAAIACGVPCLAIVCREPTTVTCGFAGATTNIVVAPSHCMYSPR